VGDHPVKVPPELVEFVVAEAADLFPEDEGDLVCVYDARDEHLANYFAQWGADQELEACCEVVRKFWGGAGDGGLFAARRPKPPTLAEQALRAAAIELDPAGRNGSVIMAALNRLAELEDKQ
jgi:GAF domain-containing protein